VLSIRRSLSTVTIALCGALVAVELHRLALFDVHSGLSKLVVFERTDTRCDGLLAGALLAQFWVRGRAPRRGVGPAAWIAVAFLAWCVARVPATSNFYPEGGFALVAIAGAVVILAAADSTWSARRVLASAPLVAVGVVSYGIYLWHFPVFVAVQYLGGGWGVAVRVVVAASATAAFTVLSWRFVERPFLRLKRRFDGRGRTQAGDDPALSRSERAP
jgi:peptidoglycan/LPS O-acetylase OafA/YrhL